MLELAVVPGFPLMCKGICLGLAVHNHFAAAWSLFFLLQLDLQVPEMGAEEKRSPTHPTTKRASADVVELCVIFPTIVCCSCHTTC